MLHNCHADGMCVDTIGMFNCTCQPGFSGNGTFCENGKRFSFFFFLKPAQEGVFFSVSFVQTLFLVSELLVSAFD